jgi:hypothetical protein
VIYHPKRHAVVCPKLAIPARKYRSNQGNYGKTAPTLPFHEKFKKKKANFVL